MDNWNNEQKPDISVSGQFSGNPYQDQNQNTYDQSAYNQNQNVYDQSAYNQNQNVYDQSAYNQNQNVYDQSTYNQSQQSQNAYNQPLSGANAYNGQPGGNAGYGQPRNNYANSYGQPYGSYNQPPYPAPGYPPVETEEPVGVGEWTGLLAIATFVPCIGLILMLVWAFGGADNKSKANFCKAYLIIALIKLALYAILFIIWGSSLASVVDNF